MNENNYVKLNYMWNVYQYLKDYANKKVSYDDFINIYNNQKVLRDYINDCYKDVVSHHLLDEYKSLGGISFPNDIAIHDYIIDKKNKDTLIIIFKALTILIDKIYK